MSQTILDEYLAAMEPDDEQTLNIDDNLPDPKDFGFDSMYAMLSAAQEVMASLGEAANRAGKLRERNDELETDVANCLRLMAAGDNLREQMSAEIERLKAQQWLPVSNDEYLGSIEISGDKLTLTGADANSIFVYLPDDLRLCRKV